MKSTCMVAAFTVLLAICASAFKSTGINARSFELSLSMKDFQSSLKKSLVSIAIVPLLLASTSAPAHAADDIQSYYWGVGCFWHTQHEFIGAEKRILGRTDEQLTVGYLLNDVNILKSIYQRLALVPCEVQVIIQARKTITISAGQSGVCWW